MGRNRNLKAKRGDSFQEKYELLIDCITATKVTAGSGLKVTITPNGTLVTGDRNIQSFAHPFRVSRTGNKFTVREGTVNGLIPFIEDVPMSGYDSAGKKVTVPKIEAESDGNTTTYIAIELNLTENSRGELGLEETKDTLRVGHIQSLEGSGMEMGGVSDVRGRAVYPIARINWTAGGKSIQSVFQIVHHNLTHRYSASNAGEGVTGRHFFWAA